MKKFISLILFLPLFSVYAQFTETEVRNMISQASEKELVFNCSRFLQENHYHFAELITNRLLEINPESPNYNYRKGFLALEIRKDYLGAIYGFISPLEMVAKEPGEWQSFDITLVGRLVTLVGNGKQIIYKQEIPGITGGAMDSNESEPGPIMIQGDHGPVEYRNIILTPAK